MAIQKISNAVIADDAVSADNIATGAITVADIPDGEITNAKIDTVAASKVTGEISTSQIADTAVTSAKIDTVASTKVTGRVQDNEDLPNIRPSLLLDFANQKTLDPRITFTRDSTATYYDGVTHAKAEENLFIYSEQFDQNPNGTGWDVVSATVSANSVAAPDGTTTADTINAGTLNNFHNINQDYAFNGTYTFSVYLKAGTTNYAHLYTTTDPNDRLTINLSSGVISQPAVNFTSSISAASNGWYRVAITFTSTASNGQVYIGPANGDNSLISYTGSNETIYVWGAQLEQRSSVTAYTPTTTQPITNYVPVLQTAGSNKPRFDHDPITGESKGLLIEEQRTNLLSESVAQSTSWGGNFTTSGGEYVIPDEAIAPDGTKTAAKIGYVYIAGQQPRLNLTGITLGANTYTMSFYAKAGEWNYISASFYYNSYAYLTVDLSDGSVHNANISANDYSIQDVGNGWYRIVLTYTSAGTLNNNPTGLWPSGTGLDAGFNTAGESVDANGYNGVYVWGAQIEVGSFSTSYIPTSGSQVTRGADSASMTGTNFSDWYRQDEGTLYAEAVGQAVDSTIFAFDDGSGTDQIHIGFDDNAIRTYCLARGTVQSVLSTSYDGTLIKVAAAHSRNDVAFTAGGTTPQVDTSQEMPRVTQAGIGRRLYTGGYVMTGTIKKIAYYPKRLSNAQLQALTED